MLRSLLKNWGRLRCVDFWAVQGADEGAYPHGSVTEEQHSTAQKAKQPSGEAILGHLAALLAPYSPMKGMRFARALPYGPS